jgi:hypothetical protein
VRVRREQTVGGQPIKRVRFFGRLVFMKYPRDLWRVNSTCAHREQTSWSAN